MPKPLFEVIPSRPAICKDARTTLDLLIRITSPLPEVHVLRPPINLGLVLDRSGSMSSGRKMAHAREAARFAVSQMLSTDRLSVTIFDDVIETIVPSGLVQDKPAITAKIQGITPRGSTALHAGWAAGSQQVLEHLVRAGLNRVLLVSDGLANVGLTDPVAICMEVQGMASREVSTSTIGVGNDYNEQLLSEMAQAGSGTYYYVDNPVQLADIFQTELKGLMGTVGRHVELSLQPSGGVSEAGLLSDLQRGAAGQLLLPDMICDMPITILLRLEVAPREGWSEICRFKLTWETADAPAGARERLEIAFSLDAVTKQTWDQMTMDPVVRDQFAMVETIQTRDAMYEAIKGGQVQQASHLLDLLRKMIEKTELGRETEVDLEMLKDLEQKLARGDYVSSSKLAHVFSHQRKQARLYPGYQRPSPPGGET